MKKKGFKLKHFITALVIFYIAYVLIEQQLMIIRIKKDIVKYTEENSKIEETNAYLKDQIEFAKTDEYMEKIARERIGLIKPGEIMYVIDQNN